MRETGHCEPSYVGCPFYIDWTTENANNSAVTGISKTDQNGDYRSGSGTLFFDRGINEHSIIMTGIPVPGNPSNSEPDEFFFIKLRNARGANSNVHAYITGSNPYAVFITEAP